ncbi:hypothetical protein [Streptomyces ziwulingensis]|uniref:Uncharacterized protein n=1 Tax=Streptomyces ziwulingensis TaxID=1045501 RepID=A0ABP9CWK8_9ACTN
MSTEGSPRGGRTVTLRLPRAVRAVSVLSSSGTVVAVADGWFVHNAEGLWAVVVLNVAGMAYDLADRALRRR